MLVTHDELHDYGEITPRSVLFGAVACALISVLLPTSEYLIGASRMNLSQLPVGAFGLFFTIVLVNIGIGRFFPTWALSPAEVLAVFAMALIGAVMATADLLGWVFAVDAVPYYLATPENRWMDDLWPHLRQWAVVQGPSEELRWAFVGMPSGVAIPWRIWVVPAFWWGTFVGAVAFGSICLASIMRRQWAEHERLAFPLAQVPLDIMGNPGGRFNIPAMMRKRAFWIGASIPLFVIMWNIVYYFQPQFPRLPIMDEQGIQLGPGFPETLAIKLNMYVVGFAYMVNTNVLFSVWVWYLIVFLQSTILLRVGYTLGGADDLYSSRDALTSWQGFGGFIVFVFWGFWMARHHLRDVWYSVIGKIKANDEHELLPYRWAVPGLVAAALYMGGYLIALGMSWGMVLVYLFGAFVAFYGTTRVIAQTGLVYMQSPLTPTMFTFYAFGTQGVASSAIVGMVGTYSLVVNGRAPLMPGIFHVSYLGAKIGRSGRRMFVALAMALTVAYLIGTIYMIYISYTHGVTTFLSWAYHQHGEQVYDAVIKKMQARMPVDAGRWSFLGIGALVMAILTFLQYRVPGWPLHPIGFPIAAAGNIRMMFFSIFLTWVIKSILLRVGGVEAYERARPAFLGIIAGYALGVFISFFVDWIWFPGAGHQIHNW
ncbi:MAG TPA: hypothetical protein PK251_10155 [Candidatus Latescibacteria bacterium]|nr:hypothetical protein [Candidatus Latescibacterota bacterium]HOS65102.1 hypothetical protein [Candidatus Latescibacterota bacterium]HPK74321.1 hypothetical protein [Candidatus Latescibacterota bacterium]HQE61414.1 hypothetical protein [Candidatus Latescibacterota bacterium]HQK21485.1 hypothetical protein [Candidatus Latescibacterota bacterium]